MDIRLQSIRFDADQKLIDFIDKKVSKLSKFFDNIVSTDVVLSLEPDHIKKVQIKLGIPGEDLISERTAETFEDAVVDCVDVLQDRIVKMKEKRYGK